MKYEILSVSEPRGLKSCAIDDRPYTISAKDENGTIIQTDVPVCFSKKSIKIHLDRCLYKRDLNSKIVVKKGDVL